MGPERNLAERRTDYAAPASAAAELPHALRGIVEDHRPSRMPFFRRVGSLPRNVAADPYFLGQIHLNYQAAMHAMRAAAYHLPHLDSPRLRRRKLRLLCEDDGQPDGDTHHEQLTRAFRDIGAACVLDDEEFGEPEEMCCYLDAETAHFVRLTQTLYARSLGPWCAIELMSGDWMAALARAFAVHFPQFAAEPYFAEPDGGRRAREVLAITETVLQARPELLRGTLRDAKTMAEALDGVWTHLDRIAQNAWTLAAPRRGHAG